MSKQKKPPLIAVRDWDHASALLADLIAAAADVAKLKADLTAKVTAAAADFEEKHGLTDRQLRALNLRASIEVFADAHRADFPKDSKTKDLPTGSVQFREGNDACAQLTRAWTWDKIFVEVVAAAADILRDYGINPGPNDSVLTAAKLVVYESDPPTEIAPERLARYAALVALIALKADLSRKQVLAAHKDKKLTDADLAALGLRVAPEESFLIRALDGTLIE